MISRENELDLDDIKNPAYRPCGARANRAAKVKCHTNVVRNFFFSSRRRRSFHVTDAIVVARCGFPRKGVLGQAGTFPSLRDALGDLTFVLGSREQQSLREGDGIARSRRALFAPPDLSISDMNLVVTTHHPASSNRRF